MRILTRYILAELLKVFLAALAGVTLMFLLFGVLKEAYLEGLGFKQVLLLIPYVLPEAMRFSVPAAMLFAGCNVFGRLSSANEVIAVKASGISPMVLLYPAMALAFFLSLWAVWLNDSAVCWGFDGAARVVIEAVEEIAYGRLNQQQSYSAKNFSINVGDVDGKRLIRPTIMLAGTGDNPSSTIVCEEATMHSDLQANTLTIACRNGTVEMGDFSVAFVVDLVQRQIALGTSDVSSKNHTFFPCLPRVVPAGFPWGTLLKDAAGVSDDAAPSSRRKSFSPLSRGCTSCAG